MNLLNHNFIQTIIFIIFIVFFILWPIDLVLIYIFFQWRRNAKIKLKHILFGIIVQIGWIYWIIRGIAEGISKMIL